MEVVGRGLAFECRVLLEIEENTNDYHWMEHVDKETIALYYVYSGMIGVNKDEAHSRVAHTKT